MIERSTPDSGEGPATRRPPRRVESPPAVRVGDLLGGTYRVRRALGRGGQGEIVLAMDESLGRLVALKWLDSRDAGHLLDEGRHLARSPHPGIVSVYGMGEHAGAPFLVLEYMRGGDLRRWSSLFTDLPPVDHIVRRVVEVAHALEALHRAGLVHRDVKPENVLLAELDGHAKLADLGLSRRAGYEPSHRIHGTLEFMAPEVLRGETEAPARDVFALAVMTYLLLTGEVPWPIENRRNGDGPRRLHDAQIADPAPRASAHRPELCSAFDDALLAGLALDAAERPGPLAFVWGLEDALSFCASPRWRVLVVDDDPDFRALAAVSLQGELPRVEVSEAQTAAEALAQVERVQPDLVVVDLHMPERSGFELAAELRATRPTLPIVIATGAGGARDWRGLTHVATDFVVKPIVPRDFARRVATLLDR